MGPGIFVAGQMWLIVGALLVLLFWDYSALAVLHCQSRSRCHFGTMPGYWSNSDGGTKNSSEIGESQQRLIPLVTRQRCT